jgi:hypothetical protein
MVSCHVCGRHHTSLDEAGHCCRHTWLQPAPKVATVVDEYRPVDDAARELELLEERRCQKCESIFCCCR